MAEAVVKEKEQEKKKDGPRLVRGWLTTEASAELAGMRTEAFRAFARRVPDLWEQRQMLGPLVCFPEKTLRAALKERKGQGHRSDLVRS